ncbi:hypothetical protein J6590_018196 [Homalodisca vitripennis]|nr:hypothetical protein J6590_018196 [Homalodisca vitripennis]
MLFNDVIWRQEHEDYNVARWREEGSLDLIKSSRQTQSKIRDIMRPLCKRPNIGLSLIRMCFNNMILGTRRLDGDGSARYHIVSEGHATMCACRDLHTSTNMTDARKLTSLGYNLHGRATREMIWDTTSSG